MIIRSLLDTDLYKFTMMQVVLHHFPAAEVEYRYKCRNDGIDLTPYVDEIRDEIAGLCRLRFQDEELKYLLSLRFIKSDFVDFLSLFHLQQKYITVQPSPLNNGEIDILVKGPWLHTILFEVPVLAIVNEVYFRATQKILTLKKGESVCTTKWRSSATILPCLVVRWRTMEPDAGFHGVGTKKWCRPCNAILLSIWPVHRTSISR